MDFHHIQVKATKTIGKQRPQGNLFGNEKTHILGVIL
jgi:hypothetical protein